MTRSRARVRGSVAAAMECLSVSSPARTGRAYHGGGGRPPLLKSAAHDGATNVEGVGKVANSVNVEPGVRGLRGHPGRRIRNAALALEPARASQAAAGAGRPRVTAGRRRSARAGAGRARADVDRHRRRSRGGGARRHPRPSRRERHRRAGARATRRRPSAWARWTLPGAPGRTR